MAFGGERLADPVLALARAIIAAIEGTGLAVAVMEDGAVTVGPADAGPSSTCTHCYPG
jgi:hypothetical protein